LRLSEHQEVRTALSVLANALEASENSSRLNYFLDCARENYDKDFDFYLTNLKRIGFTGGQAVLDVGCGAGHWSLALAQSNDFVAGIDINQEFTQICRMVAANFAYGYRTRFLKAAAETIPYPEDFFDFVLCHGVLMFTDHDLALSEFNRVMKPGAKLYLGYSGPGWYLAYVIEDGIIKGHQGRLTNGLQVLTDTFKWLAGLGHLQNRWLGLPSTALAALLEQKGFRCQSRPGIQDGRTEFLGFEGTYDLVAEKAFSENGRLPDGGPAALKQQLSRQVDLGQCRPVLTALTKLSGGLDPRTAGLLAARAWLKLGRPDQAGPILAKIPPAAPEEHLVHALWRHAAGDFGRALGHYPHARTLTNEDDVNYLAAECIRESGHPDEALWLFQGLVERDPASLRGWVGCLACHFALKNAEALHQTTRKLLETFEEWSRQPEEVQALLSKLPVQSQVNRHSPVVSSGPSAGPALEAQPAEFKAAFAELDITPAVSRERPLYLQGLGGAPRAATEVSCPLKMQLLLLEDRLENRLLLITADLFGFGPQIVKRIHLAAEACGLEPEQIILNASHTHYAPGTTDHTAAELGPFYPEFAEGIAAAVGRELPLLLERLEAADLAWGAAEARIGVNRRLSRQGQTVFAPNEDGFYDGHTPLIRVHFKDKNKKVLLVNHGCHPTGLGQAEMISADFPGYFRQTLIARGLADGVMFLQGALGTVKEASRDNGRMRFCQDARSAQDNGELLAEKVIEALEKGLQKVTGPMAWTAGRVELPLKPLPPAEALEQISLNDQAPAPVRRWAADVLARYPSGEFPRRLGLKFQCLALGPDLRFIALPGEPAAELAVQIRSLAENPEGVFILGCTNGLACYLPTETMLQEGGYEVDASPFIYRHLSALDQGTETAMIGSIQDALKNLESKEEKLPAAEFSPWLRPDWPVSAVFLIGGPEDLRRAYAQILAAAAESADSNKPQVIGPGFLHPYVLKGLGLSEQGEIQDPSLLGGLVQAFLTNRISVIAHLPGLDQGLVVHLEKILTADGLKYPVCFAFLDHVSADQASSDYIRRVNLAESDLPVEVGLSRILAALIGGEPGPIARPDAPEAPVAAGVEEPPGPVFIVGAPRSGTTLLYQLLVNRFQFSYFSNFIARRLARPVAAALVQHRLFGTDVQSDYDSKYGATEGELGPSEAGEFWYRWFPRPPRVYVRPGDTPIEARRELFQEIMGISAVTMRPMLIKNTFNSMRIAALAETFPRASFIICRRNPLNIAQSLLKGRVDLHGNKRVWWSLPPKEIDQIADHYPWDQVAEQVHYIYSQIEEDRGRIGPDRFFSIDYARFCQDPGQVMDEIGRFLRKRGHSLRDRSLDLPPGFKESSDIKINETDYRLIEDRLVELGELEASKKSKRNTLKEIEDFITASPQGSIFCRPWWLEALAPGQWDYLTVFKNDRIAALMPIVWQIKDKKRIILHPPLTQTLGVLLPRFDGKYAKALSQEVKLTTELIEKLPDYLYFVQNFNYNFNNWLPFHWAGFNQTTRYTYVIEDLIDLDRVWRGFRENIKTDIRKAEKQVEIVTEPDLERFLEVNELTFTRQGLTLPYPRELVRRLDKTLSRQGARKMFFAVDGRDRVHAAAYLVWDQKSAYYLMGGGDPELRNSGATALTIWAAIKFAASVTDKFDFEGSMMPRVEKFFRSFGGTLKPYFQISRKAE